MKRLTISGGLVAITAIALLAQPAVAQSPAKKANVYKAKGGFSLNLPAGWSSRNDGQEQFYAPGIAKGDFHDNLNLRTSGPLELNDANVKVLHEILEREYAKMFKGFKIVSYGKRKLGKYDAVHLIGTLKVQGIDAVINQAMISGPGKSVIITCTLKASRAARHGEQCEKSFASVKF